MKGEGIVTESAYSFEIQEVSVSNVELTTDSGAPRSKPLNLSFVVLEALT